jgi:hypothetical protein
MDVESWWLSIGRGNNRTALEASSGLEELAEDREAYRVMPLRRPIKAERELVRRGEQWRAASKGSGRPSGRRMRRRRGLGPPLP